MREIDAYEIARALCEKHDWQMATYAEPGYSGDVILGSYWCRCAFGPEDDRAKGRHLHGLDYHHPRLFAALEEAGISLDWGDEWIVDGNGRAWRTQPDSYSWQSSILWGDGDFLTPDDGVEEWVEVLKDDPSRALTGSWWDAADLEELGWVQLDQDYESGWHPGQTDDPRQISAGIREQFGDEAEILFTISGVGQFDVRFAVWVRPVPISLSSGHFSTDSQLEDAISFLETREPDQFAAFLAAFPEWEARQMEGAWFDTDAMGVDAEWSSWAIDWVEENTGVMWEDGEPWFRVNVGRMDEEMTR